MYSIRTFGSRFQAAPRFRFAPTLPADRPKARVRVYRLAPESIIIAALCLADLATTIFWVSYRDAMEANPIMSYYLDHGGTLGFAGIKLVLLAMPLLIAEWARHRTPIFVRNALRLTILAYVAMYGMGVYQINHEAIDFAALGVDNSNYIPHGIPHGGAQPRMQIATQITAR